MSEILIVMSLLESARAQGLDCERLEVQASRLLNLYAIVGESRAYRAARTAYLRELASLGMPIEA